MIDCRRVFMVGAGALGSALAAVLHQLGRAEVILVGRSLHWQAVRERGLVFQPPDQEPVHLDLATAGPEEVPDLTAEDTVLLTGKLPDLMGVAAWLGPRLSPETGLVALQNGLYSDEYAAGLFGRPVDRGLVFFGANSQEPGQVHLFGRGFLRLRGSAVTEALVRLLQGGPITGEIQEDFRRTEWAKLAVNCVANPLSGILDTSIQGIIHPALDPAKEAILAEVRIVARAEGVELTTTAQDINRYFKRDNRPSLWFDLQRGRKTEIEYLNGAVVRLAEKHGLDAPVNRAVVSMVEFLGRRGGNK